MCMSLDVASRCCCGSGPLQPRLHLRLVLSLRRMGLKVRKCAILVALLDRSFWVQMLPPQTRH